MQIMLTTQPNTYISALLISFSAIGKQFLEAHSDKTLLNEG